MSATPTYGAPIKLETARKLADVAEAEAVKNGWNMAIAIVDCGGNLVLLHKMDGTQLGSIEVSQMKAKTAINFKRSTKLIDEGVTNGGAGLRMLGVPGVAPLEGGELLLVGNEIVGAIGISGSLSSNDGIVARAAVAAL
ncbi:MAG: heme-binding protein [Leptospirales bacterium]|nr:heme-binding protein [Leptospirales bacterium]